MLPTSTVGLYKCTYNIEVAGQYKITINVGRVGNRDAVSGDPFSPSDPNINSINAALRSGGGRADFTITVQAGGAFNPECSVQGSQLTLTTAGVSSTFIVTGQDKYTNRIAGGSDINALLTNIADWSITPSQVQDNQDGTYSCTYVTSTTGTYFVNVTLNGFGIGDSPFTLVVFAQGASIDNTYAYGTFLNTKTGIIFTVFVQTRDPYGNYLTSESEDVIFESCITLGPGCSSDADTCTCGGDGGLANPDVTIERFYGRGPNVADTDDYPGLYKFNYYLFSPGSFVNVVQHNMTYIACYFDEGNETDSSKWIDPVDAADKCTQYNRREAVLNEEGRRKIQKAIAGCPTLPVSTHDINPEYITENASEIERQGYRCSKIQREALMAQELRRKASVGPSFFSKDGLPLGQKTSQTKPTFVDQNRSLARFWIILAPIICAAIAFAVVFVPLLVGLVYARIKRLSNRKTEISQGQENLNQFPGQSDQGESPKPGGALAAPVTGAADSGISASASASLK